MAVQVTNGLNLNQTAIINLLMHPVAGDPATPVEGQVWYNSVLEAIRFRDSGANVTLAAGAGIASLVEDTTPQLGGNLDPNGFLIDGRDVGADGTKLDGIESGADVTDATNVDSAGAVMTADTTLAGYGWFLDDDTFAADDATKVASQQSTKAFIASQVAGFSAYQGGYDAATNTPDLDTSPSGISQGDQYTVTAAGTFFTAAVEVGDLLIAEADDAATEAEWTIVQRNLDQATETVAGIGKVATDAVVSTGTNDTDFITAVKLATRLAALYSTVTRKFSELIGNGADTAIVVPHNLGTKDIVVSVREISSDELVLCDVVATSTNSATLTFATAPASNTYQAIVVG